VPFCPFLIAFSNFSDFQEYVDTRFDINKLPFRLGSRPPLYNYSSSLLHLYGPVEAIFEVEYYSFSVTYFLNIASLFPEEEPRYVSFGIPSPVQTFLGKEAFGNFFLVCPNAYPSHAKSNQKLAPRPFGPPRSLLPPVSSSFFFDLPS